MSCGRANIGVNTAIQFLGKYAFFRMSFVTLSNRDVLIFLKRVLVSTALVARTTGIATIRFSPIATVPRKVIGKIVGVPIVPATLCSVSDHRLSCQWQAHLARPYTFVGLSRGWCWRALLLLA